MPLSKANGVPEIENFRACKIASLGLTLQS